MPEFPTPHFIIGGAPRSATTALAHTLDRHPGITMAKPFVPEPKVLFAPGASPADHAARYAELFADAGDTLRGEKTSNYLESDIARETIRTTLPDVKLVFTVRDPVERAHSNWRWSRSNGLEDLSFGDAIEQEGQRPDPLPDRPHARPFDYLRRSDYGTLARQWFEALGTERVHFVLYEELIGAEQSARLHRLQEFVGAEPRDLGPMPRHVGNETRTDDDPGTDVLDPALRDRLRERLAPSVREFAELTCMDIGRWGWS